MLFGGSLRISCCMLKRAWFDVQASCPIEWYRLAAFSNPKISLPGQVLAASVTSVCLGFPVSFYNCCTLQHVTAPYSRYSICIGIFKSLGVPSVQRKSQGLCLAAKSVNWRDIKSFKACGTTDLLPDFKYEARRNSNKHRVHEAT